MPPVINSNDSTMWVRFITTGKTKHPGFKASYKSVGQFEYHVCVWHGNSLGFEFCVFYGQRRRSQGEFQGYLYTPYPLPPPPPLCEMIYIYMYNHFKTFNLYNSGGEKAQIRRIYTARKISRMVKQNLDVDITLGWRI